MAGPFNLDTWTRSFYAFGGAVSVSAFATGGSGTSVSPWTGWDTAITWTAFTSYHFRSGYYAYATSPNFLKSGIQLIGEAGVYLKHTGTGNAFVMDAGASSVWIQNVRVENITVLGNYASGAGTATATSGSAAIVGVGTAFTTAFTVGDTITFSTGLSTVESHVVTVITDDTHLTVDANWTANKTALGYVIGKTTNGFYLRGVRNGIFRHLAAHDVGNAGFWSEACVTNILDNFRLTYHEPVSLTYFTVRSQYGIVTTTRSADWSTTWTITNPVIEGVQTAGIWFKSTSYGNTLINGTSEGHVGVAVGIQLDGASNTIINTDVEFNASGNDIIVTGQRNTLLNVFSDGTVTVNGSHNIVQGGDYHILTVTQTGGAGYYNIIQGPKVDTFNDTGNATLFYGATTAAFLAKLGVVLPQIVVPNVTSTAPTDASLGSVFHAVIGQNVTFSNPTNPSSWQRITWRLYSVGDFTVAWGNKFRVIGAVALPTQSGASGVNKYVEAIYNSTDDKWDVIAAP